MAGSYCHPPDLKGKGESVSQNPEVISVALGEEPIRASSLNTEMQTISSNLQQNSHSEDANLFQCD